MFVDYKCYRFLERRGVFGMGFWVCWVFVEEEKEGEVGFVLGERVTFFGFLVFF